MAEAAARSRKKRKTPIRANGRDPLHYVIIISQNNSFEQLPVQRVIAISGVLLVLVALFATLTFGDAA